MERTPLSPSRRKSVKMLVITSLTLCAGTNIGRVINNGELVSQRCEIGFLFYNSVEESVGQFEQELPGMPTPSSIDSAISTIESANPDNGDMYLLCVTIPDSELPNYEPDTTLSRDEQRDAYNVFLYRELAATSLQASAIMLDQNIFDE